MATTTPNADLMSRLARAGFSVSKRDGELERAQSVLALAEGNARVVLHEAIVDGRLSKAYASAFDSGYVAAILKYGDSEAGLAKGARVMGLADKKRTDKQQAAVKAARNARSRLCKKLNIKAASDAGRKRGTKMSPPASTTSEGPTLAESQANTSKPRTAVPVIVNHAEMLAYHMDRIAEMKATYKRNPKASKLKVKRALEAFEKVVKAEFGGE